MNNVYHNEIIFGTTMERALLKLAKIYNEIIANNDEAILRRTNDMIHTSKRRIKAVSTGYSSRGYRCSKSYVDCELSIRMLHEVIYPCMCLYYNGSSIEDSIEYFGW